MRGCGIRFILSEAVGECAAYPSQGKREVEDDGLGSGPHLAAAAGERDEDSEREREAFGCRAA